MKLKIECEFCAGTAVMIINPTQDPQYDEDYPCDYCSDGLVKNKEAIEERILELEDTISNLNIKISKITQRYNELVHQISEHIYYLKS
jgi:hypothetical protein